MKKILSLIMVIAMLGTVSVSLVSCDVSDVEALLDILGDIDIDSPDLESMLPDVLESIKDYETETDRYHEVETSADGSNDNGSSDKPYIGPNGNWWIGDTDTGIKADQNGGEDETDAETEGKPDVVLPDFDDFDFKGKVINTLAWEECVYDEFDPEFPENRIDKAVFLQLKTTEKKLNVSLEYEFVGISDYTQNALKHIYAGEYFHDAFASYSVVAPVLMVNGVILDLTSLDYINLDAPYWAEGLYEECSVYGKLYFATGDISPSYFANTYVTFHDPSMVSADELKKINANVSSVSELVSKGEWTIEAMRILSKDAASDLNGDSLFGAEDSYGMIMNISAADALAQGADISILGHNDDGALVVKNDALIIDKSVDLIDSLLLMLDQFDANDTQLCSDVWTNGNAMFYVDRLYAAEKSCYERSEDFSILPLPKFNGDQEEYVCAVGSGYTMWSIPITANSDISSAVLETLASEGYAQEMSATVYATVLGEQTSGDMFNQIRNSARFDAGRVFNRTLDYIPLSIFRKSIENSSNTFASDYAENVSPLSSMVDKVNAVAKKLE